LSNFIACVNEKIASGYLEELKQFKKIKSFLKLCKDDITDYKPDVVILVDFGGFNLRIAKFCKKNGIRVYYYISPKVWAWNQSRAKGIKTNVDRMFCIMPFEKEFYKKFDWEVDYVGNPVMDAVKAHKVDGTFKVKWNFSDDQPIIALLPGSRKQELKSMLPVMHQVVKKFPNYQFGVAAIRDMDEAVYAHIANESNVKLVMEDTYNLLANATSAVVTSGTATLETALWNVPQVVPYHTSKVSFAIAKALIKVKYISLVNLISDKEVVKELIQNEMTPKNISTELLAITEGNKRAEILEDYKVLHNIMGQENASEKAAKLMVGYLTKELANHT